MLEAKIDERLHWWKKHGEVFLAATGVKWQFRIEILVAALVPLWQICFTVFWLDSYIIRILSVRPHAWKETGDTFVFLMAMCLCYSIMEYAAITLASLLCGCVPLCAPVCSVLRWSWLESRLTHVFPILQVHYIPLARAGVQKGAHERSWKNDFNWFHSLTRKEQDAGADQLFRHYW